MKDKEQKLIKKIKKCNQKAFKELYNLYANYALRTAYAISKNQEDASDIVQETFIKVFRNIDSFDESKKFKPWFYRILINESNRFMKKRVAPCEPLENRIEFLTYKQQSSKSLDSLEDALEQLDEINRTTILLKYINNLTEKEIAEVLDLNINTVKSRLYKGREKLKKILGGMGYEEKRF